MGTYHPSLRPRTPVFLPDGVAFVEGQYDLYGSGALLFVNREVFVIGDCNNNGTPDDCDISNGSADCNGNGILESCEPLVDCNANQVQDACDIAWGASMDSDGDGRPNECEIAIVGSHPPNGSIDARQPHRPFDVSPPMGWRTLTLYFDANPANGEVQTGDFEIVQVGGSLPPPSLTSFHPRSSTSGDLVLSRPLEPLTWTTIRHRGSLTSVRLGYLPGDVNGDAVSNAVDVLSLVDALNSVGEPRPLFQTDINRSGVGEPSDILRLIDLLNGADAYPVFDGATLPE